MNFIIGAAGTKNPAKQGKTTMFDLWGQECRRLSRRLKLAEAEVPIKGKLAWEKELMGVYLSEHPFSACG